MDEIDYRVSLDKGLSHGRSYRSLYGPTNGMFGPRSNSSLAVPKLVASGCYKVKDVGCVATTLVVTSAEGTTVTYLKSAVNGESFTYKALSSILPMGFMTSTLGYDRILIRPLETSYFNSDGSLGNITRPGGFTLKFGYSQGLLSSVQNQYGQKVTFTYTGSHVSSLTDPDGKIWQYGCNTYGMLATVKAPDGRLVNYFYESSYGSDLLTGVSYDGVRYSTYRYYASRQVSESALSGGEVKDTFSYAAGSTTLTNAAGLATKYSYATVSGSPRITDVSRGSMKTCSATTATTKYDPSGYLDYSVDWNGTQDGL